jgi:hypothetical protein
MLQAPVETTDLLLGKIVFCTLASMATLQSSRVSLLGRNGFVNDLAKKTMLRWRLEFDEHSMWQ